MIKEGKLIGCAVTGEHNGIRPALVLYFDGHSPMPIRFYRWKEYFDLIIKYGVK